MLKIVLVMMFAAFAPTTALPLRNTFYEDVDDYSRDFIPKENADYDESAYDGYLFRRDPIERNSDLLGKYPSIRERLYDEFYNRDLPEDDKNKAEEDEGEYEEDDNDYDRELNDDRSFPKYSREEDAEESLYREEEPLRSDDEEESYSAPVENDDSEAEYFEEDPNDVEAEETEDAEDEALPSDDEPEEVSNDFADDALETAEEEAEAAQDDEAHSAPAEEDTAQQDEAKEDSVKDEAEMPTDEDEAEMLTDEDEAKEEDEPEKEENAEDTSEEEDEAAEVSQNEDESDKDKYDDDTFADDEIEEVPQEEDEAKEEEEAAKEEDEAEETGHNDDAGEKAEDEAKEEEEAEDVPLEEDAAEEVPQEMDESQEEDYAEKEADEPSDDEDEAEEAADHRVSASRFRDLPSVEKMVMDTKKLERELALEGEATVENESPKEDADAPMPEAVAQSGTKVSGAWVEVCSKDETSGWRHRPAHVLKHTQSTMHMMTVEPALGGKLLRIVLRGQFFLYNQIRLMVGTAVAIVAGVLPEELLEAALVLTTEMHMPLAPATGLLLRTAGFSRLDERAGCCAMDPQQAREVMLPSNGFVLMDEKAATASTDFVRAVEMDMDLQWTQSKEAESWRSKLRFLRPPSGDVMEELRAMKEKALKENADLRISQDARDSKRREAQLASLGEKSHVGLLPRRFAAACMVRFRLVPGWRLNNIQSALTARMREWHQEPSALPEGMSMPPETQELLDYCTAVGIEELADEGAKL